MKPAAALAAALALAACSREAPEPVPSQTTTAVPAPASSSAASTTAAAREYPEALLGRWGMVPGDCTSQLGDDKGKLIITPREIRFYESVATIATVKESSPRRLRATLAYEGEGMQWTREAMLEAGPKSDQLVFEEFGEDAIQGPRTYTRCK
ncbi:MAG: hypothetical protein JSR28_04855 [Proteobacteria bacterium]|nr:hypothetical protein [Pseudomonadota bacterium]